MENIWIYHHRYPQKVNAIFDAIYILLLQRVPIYGPVAQWITRLTTDQKIPGSTPGRIGAPHFFLTLKVCDKIYSGGYKNSKLRLCIIYVNFTYMFITYCIHKVHTFLVKSKYIHNWPLQPSSQDYWPSFSHHLCCVLILYISGGTYSLKSTSNDRFEKLFMAILFTLKVFARNLLRGNRRRNTFRISFRCLAIKSKWYTE